VFSLTYFIHQTSSPTLISAKAKQKIKPYVTETRNELWYNDLYSTSSACFVKDLDYVFTSGITQDKNFFVVRKYEHHCPELYC